MERPAPAAAAGPISWSSKARCRLNRESSSPGAPNASARGALTKTSAGFCGCRPECRIRKASRARTTVIVETAPPVEDTAGKGRLRSALHAAHERRPETRPHRSPLCQADHPRSPGPSAFVVAWANITDRFRFSVNTSPTRSASAKQTGESFRPHSERTPHAQSRLELTVVSPSRLVSSRRSPPDLVAPLYRPSP